MASVKQEQDTFPTVYKKDYVWHESRPDHQIFTAPDAFALNRDEQKAFFDPNTIKAIPWEEQLEIINNLYAQRMKTTYFTSYCEKLERKSAEDEKDEVSLGGDTLIESAEKLFAKKSRQVLQPVGTSRRVMGYSRPAYYYTGVSEYQDEYSRMGLGQLVNNREARLKPRLPFCDQFKLN